MQDGKLPAVQLSLRLINVKGASVRLSTGRSSTKNIMALQI